MKERLDVTLLKLGLAESRQKAKELIIGGHAEVNGSICIKPSYEAGEDDDIRIVGNTLRYVGRGGLKLEKAIKEFSISVSDKVCMDIGASTGGFTDCMLQNGADMVYALDVGSGQLAEKLRLNSRVVNMEKTDIRDVKALDKPPEFISADVSFISLRLILDCIYQLLAKNGTAVALIKPQFEAGRENVGKNGIVKSEKVHIRVIEEMLAAVQRSGFTFAGLCHSPIRGAKGNIEYLIYLKKDGSNRTSDIDIKAVVDKAFEEFKTGGKA